jgi:hypothetical protein
MANVTLVEGTKNEYQLDDKEGTYRAIKVKDVDGDGQKDTAYMPFHYATFLGIKLSGGTQVSRLGSFWAYVGLSQDGSLRDALIHRESHAARGKHHTVTTEVKEYR